MSVGLLSITIDILIMIGLGVTIFFAFRLSKSLNSFKEQRQAFQALIVDLTTNIDKAQTSIAQLKETAGSTGEDLEKVIGEARFLADELKLMNEAGESLANRLEGVADARGAERKNKAHGLNGHASDGFAIRDPEFDHQDGASDHEEWAAGDDVPVPDDLQSDAEKELYKALRANRGK